MSDSASGHASDLSLEAYVFAAEVDEMAARGVRAAQTEARAAGVPCVYSINGILHWELPDGSLTTVDPWAGRDTPPAE
ncbi:hypothetical protein [Botrimarina sp.]|uniref:hypothetical protein n=1 Tax=Botrimarina sp. TaxID=2795802 RepID=UPI0032EE2633